MYLLLFLLMISAAASAFSSDDGRPSITSENGNLIITPGYNKNISFATNGKKSHVNIEGIEIDKLIIDVKAYAKSFEKIQSDMSKLDEAIPMIETLLANKTDILNAINTTNKTSPGSTTMPEQFVRWRRRLRNLETKVNKMNELLLTNECSSNPCKNGGTCIDGYGKFICLCDDSWEGSDCSIDVNECQLFQGSVHGCQNGGTCTNLPGSFVCACPPGWYGINCHLRSQQCGAGTNSEICGHGTCIQQANGFSCLCELGWKTNGVSPECTVDIDECSGNYHPCSAIPFVPCINTPGSFKCGSCPAGYSGPGFYCVDVDECQENNGGCSTNPSVLCHNTIGSRECGECPAGYEGDGIACTYKGLCEMNNGGCHSLAKCTPNPAISSSYVLCTCLSGYVGTGIGANGCQLATPNTIPIPPMFPNHCSANTCRNGVCRNTFDGFRCICNPGYTGTTCDQRAHPCELQPCQNGGTCITDGANANGYRCECTADFSGVTCQSQAFACRDTRVAMEGNITFPETETDSYKHNSRCIWTIETEADKVLNVTFTRFKLEEPTVHGCVHDWLEIYDGMYTSYHKMGRFCGQQLSNSTVITGTRNVMVVIFKSDGSVAHTGFSLHWKSINPACGGVFENVERGEIISPGYPGSYPQKRDCIWDIKAKPGKRIEFYFTTLNIGAHSDCNHDYLKIFDGPSDSDNVLNHICNTSLPANVVSSGPNVLVHFHSGDIDDNSRSKLGYSGFRFSYSTKPAIPGCGGIYTGIRGEIFAPSFKGLYHNNMICEYLITPPTKGTIKLNFASFNLEGSIECKNDYLQIFDGDSIHSRSTSKYCGNDVPEDFYSTSNKVLVVFHSDGTISGEGFKIQYELLCHKVFTAESGILSSPDYPKVYPIDRRCTYLISLPPKHGIILDFLVFNIERISYPECGRYDYLKIYDGDSSNSPLIDKTYCGTYKPDRIVSSYNMLFLEFVSGIYINGIGWQANYTSRNMECGHIIKEMTGILTFPDSKNLDVTYDNNVTCEWILSAPPGHHIQITWLSFDLESNSLIKNCYDYVEIFEYKSQTNEKKKISRFCGVVKPPSFLTASNLLFIKFHSDESISSSGFSFSYVFTDVRKLCGGKYLSSSGTITSPGWPKSSPSNKDCSWVIQVPNGHQVKLNISSLDMGFGCRRNFLEISGGDYSMAPILGRFCGQTTPPIISSPGNYMKIHFHSDIFLSEKGFYATWESVATNCGGILDSPSGSIISPNYPEKYDGETECIWRIHTNPGLLIELTFIDLEISEYSFCLFDYVEMFNSENTETNKIGRYCSLKNTPKLILTESNYVLVKFRSDSFINQRGFLLNYHSVCNPNIVGYSGVIESPNFPKNYPSQTNCTWKINVPTGNKINITFSHFSLEEAISQETMQRIQNLSSFPLLIGNVKNSCIDFVQIKDSKEKTFSAEKTYCGDDLPPMFTSSDNETSIHFLSDQSDQYSGFRIEWIIFGCGGRLRRPSGELRTGDKLDYMSNKQCDWMIQVEEGKSVELTIERYETTNNRKSNGQSIAIYSGISKDGPKVLEFDKAKLQNATYTSSGNYMSVSVYSNTYGLFFSAKYKTVPTKCGGKLSTPTGKIFSPNYPRNYDKGSSCFWYISVADDHRVQVTFNDFDLVEIGDCKDYVKVYEGHSPNNNSLLLKSCGSNKLNETIVSVTNAILVEFFASASITAKGFAATYATSCGKTIKTESEGFINPDPSLFISGNSDSCEWNIIGSNPGDRISLTFTDLDLYNDPPKNATPCTHQFVEVCNGETSTAPIVGRYCGKKIPPTIVGRGNALTIVLSPITEPGRLFAVHYSVLSTFCGGELTAEEGKFTSPQYPDTYPANSDCTWKITPAPGNRITMTFAQFNVGVNDNCELDYLEIRENDGMGKLLGIFCGDKVPSAVTISTGVWIKFHSTNDSTGPGFVIEYVFVHGNEFDDTEFGTIASPMYPNRYTGGGTYNWRINVKFEQTVRIVIEKLELSIDNEASCSSYLAVYDGYDDKAPLLVKQCDSTDLPQIVSTSHIVYIEFNSPNDPGGSLFLLEWNAIIANPNPTSQINSTCGSNTTLFISKARIVNLQSPGYPNGYALLLKCTWTFETEPLYHLVLKFKGMSLEEEPTCLLDRAIVYSGSENSQNWDTIGSYCLPNSTSDYVETKMNWMKVEFITDISTNFSGFEADIFSRCGGEFTEPTGIITAPTLFTRYLAKSLEECIWKINVRPGRKIKVELIEMDINKVDGRCDTFFMLRDGISEESPFLGRGKYCGNDTFDAPLETTSNHLFVKYKYKIYLMLRNAGFKLRYTEISEKCEFELLLDRDFNSTTISTPNYPRIPNPHTECTWKIRAPIGERIKIDFTEGLDLTAIKDCPDEYVEIRDGGTVYSELIQRFCSFRKSKTQKSTGNMVFVKFLTDVTDPKNGFKAQVAIDYCGGTFDATSGIIKSPTKLQLMASGSDVECEWRLRVPGTHNVIMSLDMSMPSSENCENASIVVEDYLEFNKTVYPLSEKLCGKKNSLQLKSITNAVIVKMKIKKGFLQIPFDFELTYNSSKQVCGGEITANEGTIESYPIVSFPFIRDCKWKIQVDDGRRISLKILQGYTAQFANRLTFYDGWGLWIPLRVNTSGIPTVESSSNQITVYHWMRNTPGYVQIKATFTSEKQSVCGKLALKDEGVLLPPANANSFHCFYKYQMPNNENDGKTILLKFSNLVFNGTNTLFDHCNPILSHIYVQSEKRYEKLAKICKSTNETVVVRSPSPATVIEIWKKSDKIDYRIEYKVIPCGGVITLKIIENSWLTLKLPEDYLGPIDCAWKISFPFTYGKAAISLSNTTLTNNDCKREGYLIRAYGGLRNLTLRNWCDASKTSIDVNMRDVLFEYRSDKLYNATSLKLQILRDIKDSKCGNIVYAFDSTFHTPNFPSNYDNNQECLWKINTKVGYRIKVFFEKRFAIEQSPNCTKDYVEILEKEKSEWVPKRRFCGRNIPENYTSLSNELNVLFRSDSSITNNGFQARWENVCGGTYWASSEVKTMRSPGFPRTPRNIDCLYTIRVKNDENLRLNFTTFSLEPKTGGVCKLDFVTIQPYLEYTDSNYGLSTYCGKESPAVKIFRNGAKIRLRTNIWSHKMGFEFSYSIDDCGGNVNTTKIISLKHDEGSYRCIWNITAPEDKVISIRFRKFNLPQDYQCFSTYLKFFEGSEINDTRNTHKFCGNLKTQPPVIKSEMNKAILNLKADFVFKNLDIEAIITFVKVCGGTVHVNSSKSYEFRIPNQYESFLECHWQVVAPIDNVLRISYSDFHVAPCYGVNQTITSRNGCTCDYLELRDGEGSHSALIAKSCGDNKPGEAASSKNRMWIRFVSDGTCTSSGIKATITAEPSICGTSVLHVNDTHQILTPPRDSDGYVLKGIRCTWILPVPRESYKLVLIRFVDIDLEPPKDDVCSLDYLDFSNEEFKVEKPVKQTQIISGVFNYRGYIQEDFPDFFRFIYCGNVKHSNIYLYSNEVKVTLVTSMETTAKHRGFSMEYKTTGCSENFTADNGRIFSNHVFNTNQTCNFLIKVEGNKTISLYFWKLSMYNNESLITIRDGSTASSKELGKIRGGNYRPLPYFSTGNSMYIDINFQMYENLIMEATYTTTDAGQGCGGSLRDHRGIIYSPMYPLPYRGKAPCEWIVQTPDESFVTLKFKEFDLGPVADCKVDYLELLNKDNERVARYCPQDKPANYLGKNNYVKIVHRTSSNSGGSGWVIIFTTRQYFGETQDKGV